MSPLRTFHGEALELPGNSPLALTDPRWAYWVEAGAVDLFSVRFEKGEASGPRRHVLTAPEGALFFGAAPGAGGSGLLAVGGLGARARRIELARLRERVAAEPQGETAKAAAAALAEYRRAALAALSDNGAAPADGAPEAAAGLAGVECFHAELLAGLARVAQEREAAEAARLGRKSELDGQLYRGALTRLADIIESGEPDAVGEDADGLLAALRAVGREARIRFEAPPREDQGLALKFWVEAVCRASRVRSRIVALRGQWWTSDCGPLFAVFNRDEVNDEPMRAAALLQSAPGRYELFEPGTGKRTPVDEKVAATLNPFAWTFYKPFPERPLGFLDVINFVGAETRRDALMLAALAGAGAVLGLAAPWATGKLFDTVIPNAERGNLFVYGSALVAAAVSTAVFGLTQGICMMRVNSKWDGGVQAALWDRLLRLPAPFFREFTVGDLAARAGAVNTIRRTLGAATLQTVLNSLHGVFNFFLLFHYNASLALAGTGIVLAVMLVYAALLFSALRLRERLAELDGKISGLVFQLLGAVSKLRVTASERRGFAVWSKLYAESTRMTFSANACDNVIATINSMIPVLSSAAVFWLVHQQLHPGAGKPAAAMSVGDFVAFTSAFTLFLNAGMALSTTAFSVLNVVPTWRRAQPILQARPEVDSARPSSKPLAGAIQAHHLTFRYKPDGPKILDDVSFSVEPGEFVALVGPSGSGKSTVLRLLLGFETPEIGSIYYDGQDLSKFDAGSIRRQIGVVLQNGRLLAGDIFTNIVGNMPLTIDDAWAAAEAAGVADDIRAMPMGMFTVISEGASTLSGGQRQRIIIARALVRNPKKIFFDEATSALDNRTQEIVTQSLAKMKVSRVVIAHRLSTVRDADKIIVMAKGRIVQQGTFDQLMKEGGLFRELASRQVA